MILPFSVSEKLNCNLSRTAIESKENRCEHSWLAQWSQWTWFSLMWGQRTET